MHPEMLQPLADLHVKERAGQPPACGVIEYLTG
jgi:hypothetical protein